MAKIYDKLMVSLKNKKLIDFIKTPNIINVTNILQYYSDIYMGKKNFDLEQSVPSLAPPFDDFFMEGKVPKLDIFTKQKKMRDVVNQINAEIIKGSKRGVMVSMSMPAKECEGELIYELKKWGLDVKWNLMISFFNSNYEYPIWHHNILLDEKGKIINTGNLLPILENLQLVNSERVEISFPWGYDAIFRANKNIPYMYIPGKFYEHFDEDLLDRVNELISENIYPFYLAIGFMHCKNVISEEIVPPKGLSKKFQKKHGIPLVKYKTLKIKPMGKRKKYSGESKSDIKKSLHICRGHFKNFNEKPLFGKIKGTFWWSSYIRGEKKKGVVLKDYEIDKPKK